MEWITHDLGERNGPILVFGGVYSNFQALEALKAFADGEGFSPDRIICTGDVVAYCAQPEECVQLIREWGIHVIAGNVEIQLREGLDDCGCNFDDGSRCDLFSRQWYPFASEKVSQDSIDWMQTLPHHLTFTLGGKKVHVLHGAEDNVSGYVFASTDWERKQSQLDKLSADIILAGHCGLPFVDHSSDKWWLNAGVIGMPANDGTPNVWCMTMNVVEGDVVWKYHPLAYNYQLAHQLMKENNLPPQYAETLLTGIWDNCEILPEKETSEQGIPLKFD